MSFKIEDDRVYHSRVYEAKGLARIQAIKEYVEFLLPYNRIFHAENLLKYEIRSAEPEMRNSEEFSELFLLLGTVLTRQKKYYEARDALESYVQSPELNADQLAEGYWRLGTAYQSIGTPEVIPKALDYFGNVLRNYPDTIYAQISRNNLVALHISENEIEKPGKLEEDKKEMEKAIEFLSLSIEHENVRYVLSHCYDTLAMLEIMEKNFKNAENLLIVAKYLREEEKDGKITNKPTAVYYHLGRVYEHTRDMDAVKRQYEIAISTQEQDWYNKTYVSMAYDAMGIIYLKKGDMEEAEKNFKNALKFDPNNSDVVLHMQYLTHKSSEGDWWNWWTKSKYKKVSLGLLTLSAIVLIGLGLVEGSAEITKTETINETIPSGSKTIQTVTHSLPYYYIIIGIIVFVILMPSIKKVKVGTMEIETQDASSAVVNLPPPTSL